jgi:hypothetical protein
MSPHFADAYGQIDGGAWWAIRRFDSRPEWMVSFALHSARSYIDNKGNRHGCINFRAVTDDFGFLVKVDE